MRVGYAAKVSIVSYAPFPLFAVRSCARVVLGDSWSMIPGRCTMSRVQDAGNRGKCIKLVYQLAIASPTCKMMTVTLMH